MKKIIAAIISIIFVLVISRCKNKADRTEVVVYTKLPINYTTLYLSNVSLLGEKEEIIDSVTMSNNHDSVQFIIPRLEEKMYKITIKGDNHLRATFINDANKIGINMDYLFNRCKVTGSPATTSLEKINREQTLFAKNKFRLYSTPLDSLKRLHITEGKVYDSLLSAYNKQLNVFFERYVSYDDTVKSPAAFLNIYKLIDFGEDYTAFKEFVLRNSARFPNYKPMLQAKKEALDVIRVHEEDFNVGDKLPPVTLPGIDGKPFSTAALKGQYYLVDIWATYCDQCAAFKSAEMKLFRSGPTKVKLVSIAFDDNKDEWLAAVKRNKMDWTNLIDDKMWTGPAVNTLLFDSIPFNFLVDPQGRVIKKAIKADSLKQIILKLKLN